MDGRYAVKPVKHHNDGVNDTGVFDHTALSLC